MSSRKRIWEDFAAGDIGHGSQDGGLPNQNSEWPEPVTDAFQMNMDLPWELEPSVDDFQWLHFMPDTLPTVEPEVCYGCIIDVKCELVRISRRSNDTRWNVVRTGDVYGLTPIDQGQSEEVYAMINKRTCHHLLQLADGPTVRLEAFLTETDSDNEDAPNPASSTFLVDVNIYGSERLMKEVGDILDAAGVFLQRPIAGLYGFGYHNPHYFCIEHTAEDDLASQNFLLAEKSMEVASEEAGPEQLDSILNSLSHQGILQEHLADRRIKSKLLPHQKSAIDFMSQRERIEQHKDLSLWEFNDDQEDQTFWEHRITGAKGYEHDEALGGILADEMGLGKSLSIIALIAGSLNEALHYATSTKDSGIETACTVETRRPCGATLIVVPSSLLIDSWVDEIRSHTFPSSLTMFKYHGQGRKESLEQVLRSHIVLTTYATLATDSGRSDGIISQLDWYRIVLDEAHEVRNTATKRYQAVKDLSARCRWCLTGTPIQNTLDDLAALVGFLRVPILDDKQTFRKFITPKNGMGSRYENLRILLGTICLRRTRQLLGLPDPVPETREVALSEKERQQYLNIIERSKESVDMAVSKRGHRTLNAAVLESLLRLRLFCNNGSVSTSYTDTEGLPTDLDEALTYLQQRGDAQCVYCFKDIYILSRKTKTNTEGGIIIPKCNHLVCHMCRSQFNEQHQRCPSPECSRSKELKSRDKLAEARSALSANSREHHNLNEAQTALTSTPHSVDTPSKLLVFMNDLELELSRFHKPKCIVFSAWTKTLEIIGKLLSDRRIGYQFIHGSLSLNSRLENLEKFKSLLGPSVLLMTLGTGAVGLNLAVATRIYLLEPQWNPSIELQAFGRALRLGQTEQVKILRYIVKGTVEDSNIMSRQRNKLRLAGGGFATQQTRIEEMKDYLYNST